MTRHRRENVLNFYYFLVHRRLVKFPREKSFFKRVRDLNRKGDEPQMSWTAMQSELAALMARAALRVLADDVRRTEATDIARAFSDSSLGSLGTWRIKTEYFGVRPQI